MSSQHPIDTIFRHIHNKDLKMIQQALQQSAHINEKDTKGLTPLIYACQNNPSLKIVKYLLTQGASINEKANTGISALSEAARAGAYNVVKLLLQSGADLHAKGLLGMTPLIYTCNYATWSEEDIMIVKLLLDSGAKANAIDVTWNNALLAHLDKSYCHKVVRYLVDAGTKLEYVAGARRTAMGIAAEKGNLRLVKYLFQKGATIQRKIPAENPLVLAMKKNHKNVVAFLVKNGADIEARDSGFGILTFIGRHGHKEILELLPSKSDLFSMKRQVFREGLTEAARTGNLKTLQALAAKIPLSDAGFRKLKAPMIAAVKNNKVSVVSFLLSKGISTKLFDNSRLALVHLAAWYGHKKILQLLKENGADIHLLDAKGRTALFLASESGQVSCVQYLISQGADLNQIYPETGYSPLIVAVQNKHIAIVRILLKAKANPQIQNKHAKSALTWAFAHKSKTMISLLTKAGARKAQIYTSLPNNPLCAYCKTSLSPEQVVNNYCPDCGVSYCDLHYPWSNWQRIHVTVEGSYRDVMCPMGHY
ncbi:MAG: ankyrin repeat domain-containing protein, partial [Spirochaetota bacterium]